MKTFYCLALLFLTLTANAQLVRYNSNGTTRYLGDYQDSTITHEGGVVVFDLARNNAVYFYWGKLKGQKVYIMDDLVEIEVAKAKGGTGPT